MRGYPVARMYFHYSVMWNGDCAKYNVSRKGCRVWIIVGAVRNSDYVRWKDSMIHKIDGELERIWKKVKVF